MIEIGSSYGPFRSIPARPQIAQLRNDPEIIALRKKLEKHLKELIKSIPRNRSKMMSGFNKEVGDMGEVMKGLKVMEPKLSVKDAKKVTLKHFNSIQNNLLELKELFDIQNKLKGTVAYKGKVTKRTKMLQERQQQLIEKFQKEEAEHKFGKEMFRGCTDFVGTLNKAEAADDDKVDVGSLRSATQSFGVLLSRMEQGPGGKRKDKRGSKANGEIGGIRSLLGILNGALDFVEAIDETSKVVDQDEAAVDLESAFGKFFKVAAKADSTIAAPVAEQGLR